MPSDVKHWWGDYAVPIERWGRWRIGPLSLWARPLTGEWRLAWRSETNPSSDQVEAEVPAEGEPDVTQLELARYAVAAQDAQLRFTPQLADLPVVVRPETALWIPPSQRTVLYVGTSVWIRIISVGDGNPQLTELPIFRPSDTWFGNNTREGEFCYASRTKARTNLEALGYMPHRAITPVELVNDGLDTLHVEQLRIPVTALSLYAADKQLWTDGVRFIREADSGEAELEILRDSEHMPDLRDNIAAPREPIQRRSVIKAFSSLFQ